MLIFLRHCGHSTSLVFKNADASNGLNGVPVMRSHKMSLCMVGSTVAYFIISGCRGSCVSFSVDEYIDYVGHTCMSAASRPSRVISCKVETLSESSSNALQEMVRCIPSQTPRHMIFTSGSTGMRAISSRHPAAASVLQTNIVTCHHAFGVVLRPIVRI